ncbi:VOC family protein [Alicyclobacillus acidiphilus]|jgi:lactoylglutathione lyase|uniref:VOC family protein n=1 Tax=Alicyclobacillus acidiphilus TaxID=182455 RepID=UPI000836DC8C|nr:VOC family protein [Alicyclobacillus acidiphilus]
MGIQKMEHVGILARDMDVSTQFYCDVLGLEVRNKVDVRPGFTLVFLGYPDTDETLIELVPNTEESAETGIVNHLAFTVTEIAAEMSRLRGLGVKFMTDTPQSLPDGTQYIFFYGPSGEHLELFQPPARR